MMFLSAGFCQKSYLFIYLLLTLPNEGLSTKTVLISTSDLTHFIVE